jgi:retron-type reverse transcriptase
VNWVLDLDVRSFFDRLSHEWLVRFLQHRITDRRVVRLIQKWLNAGVLEKGKRTFAEAGSPQGGSASPLLANIYLHYGAPGQNLVLLAGEIPAPTRGAAASPGIESWV